MLGLHTGVWGLLSALVLAGQALGATLQVSPVKVDFAPQQHAAALLLKNPGDKPVYGQVRVFSWGQADNAEQLSSNSTLAVSPPIIQLAPGGQQLVRLIRRESGDTSQEQSYRVLIDEIPQPSALKHNGVVLRMRYSVPVFVAPAGEAKNHLLWQVVRENNRWLLRVDNLGRRHAQVGALEVQDTAGRSVQLSKGLLGYVLAGRRKQWPLPEVESAKFDGPVLIKVSLDGRSSTVKVIGKG
jgi:fimbrial chaperone protein